MKLNQQNKWISVHLGDISTFIRGVTFPKGSRLESYENGTVAVATTKAAQQPGIEHDKLYFIPKSFVKRLEQFLLPNDIVISIANSLDLVGRVTFATKKDEGITWGAFLGVIRANPKLIYPYFLYSFLTTAETKQYFRKNARTTTNISNISSDSILSLRIPVPPLAEQKRIVKKIEELFGVIDAQVKRLEATQEALVSYRQSILQQAFSGKLHKTSTWKKITLQEAVDINPKTILPVLPDSEMVSFLPMLAVQEESLEYREQEASFGKVKKGYTKFQDEDVLFAKITPCMENGKGCIVHNLSHGIGFGSTEFHVLRCHKNVFPKFIYYFVIRRSFRAEAKNKMSGAVGQQRVPAEFVKEYTIELPSLPEQKTIVKKIETAFAFADKAQAAITDALEQAKQLKQSILKRAFEGKLVPQDPNDKPIDLTQLKKDKQK